MLEISVAVRSELGRRSSNEDQVRVRRDGPRLLAVVADGAGGHHGGAEASARAVEDLDTSLHDPSTDFSAMSLTRAIHSAHARVQGAQGAHDGLDRMHTTIVVLWVDSSTGTALWSHVGDSRLYRWRSGTLDLLTCDDSVVQRMVDAGLITPQQAEVHPQKNQLIAALGIEDEVDPHTVSLPVELREGDAFLLCSDGWWGALDDRLIVEALAEAATPEDWLASMQSRVESRAAPRQDNFSAIGVWVGDAESTLPMPAGLSGP
jgi:serine/threonine protein phosphatase PrpC